MIEVTKDYNKFKLRADNREKGLEEPHVLRLMDSISARNRLELYPIVVNEQFEIINGQHRHEAAKRLGVPLYYQVLKGFDIQDMIAANTSKNWLDSDFLHVYCQNSYPEYLKLKAFMEKYRFTLKFTLFILLGKQRNMNEFRTGGFTFPEDLKEDCFSWLYETIDIIRKEKGAFQFMSTVKFQASLLHMFRHAQFDYSKWINCLKRFCYKMDIRLNQAEYIKLFGEIYNYGCRNKIDFLDLKEVVDTEAEYAKD